MARKLDLAHIYAQKMPHTNVRDDRTKNGCDTGLLQFLNMAANMATVATNMATMRHRQPDLSFTYVQNMLHTDWHDNQTKNGRGTYRFGG